MALEVERSIRERGAKYQELSQCPGWIELLNFLKKREEEALERMRGCMSSNPRVQQAFRLTWKERSETLIAVQSEVLGAIEEMREYAKLLRENNVPGWQEFMSEEELLNA